MIRPPDTTLERVPDEYAVSEEAPYEMALFVSGATDLSARAIANARQLCDTYLDGRYHLAVVDVHEYPEALLSGQVVVAPTLIKYRPLPVQQVVGDLSHTDKVASALGLSGTDDAPRTLA